MRDLEKIYKPIKRQLKKVEKNVQKIWEDVLGLVNIEHSLATKAKGKFIRPAVCLLSAGAIGEDNLDLYVPMATAFEVLHLASLTHDDVVDGADLRRGGITLNYLWSNHAAVLGGDYLVARALEILGLYNNLDLMGIILKSIREMAEGELKFFNKKLEDYSIEDSLELSLKKTGMLFVCSAIGPTFIGKGIYKQNLYNYGKNIGIAFQIMDDLLDFTQESKDLGKPNLSDITENKITLPMLYLWRHLDTNEKVFFESKMGKKLSEKDKIKIQNLFDQYHIEEQVKNFVSRLKDKSIRAIRTLEHSEFINSLIDLAEFIVERKN